jgi:hypothetical protein
MKSQLNEVRKLQKIAGILNTNNLSEKYVIPKEDEIDDDEDPLYQELANEIGERKLQKLLMKGWELEDIAEDPQGAAASIK